MTHQNTTSGGASNVGRPDGGSRLAAIDIGSNSIRLVVACPLHGGQFRIIDEERQSTRLAHRLGTEGRLDAQAMDQTLEGLRRFKQLAEGFGVTQLETIATCAVREADNGQEFVQRVHRETGLEVRVISAEQEARYAFRSVQTAFDISDSNIAVADIGGGSTEIVYASAGHVEKIYSTTLGCVRLTEIYAGTRGLFDDSYEQIRKHAQHELKQKIKQRPFAPQVLYGTGGTFTALASMIIAMRGEDSQMIWGYRVTRADVKHMLDRLNTMSVKERRNTPGLSADRADIIVAGITIIDTVMARLQTNILRVHTGGVRDGLLLAMSDALTAGNSDNMDVIQGVESFAASCGADLVHARQVAHLSVQLWDDLAAADLVAPSDRECLKAAALLQDVGYLIDYKQHHKHSYQLIVNSRLPGFRRHDLELIGNAARYHRGARPKKKHVNLRKLHKADRLRVRQMAAVLQVAGGLDRGHMQRVTNVTAKVLPNRVLLQFEASSDPDLELWAARSKAKLFERVFRRELVIQPAGEASDVDLELPATETATAPIDGSPSAD